ncbi:hypothetical protein KCV01_g11476, partial [Aureobasidium melanogenum]
MGSHWSHSFNRRLTRSDLAGGSSSIGADRPSGLQETFRKTGAGVWTTTSNNPDALTESVNSQGMTTGYTLWIAALRHKEVYSADGRLLTIQNETGQVATLSYSDALTSPAVAPAAGLLLSVTAPDGRALSFSYDANAHLHQMTLPDGGTFVYGFDGSGNLISVQYPDGKSRQYRYNEPGFMGANNRPSSMTGLIDENGVRFEDTTFDNSGRANSTQFANGIGRVSINYNADVSADVTYPLHGISHQGHTIVQGLFRVATVDKPCGECGQPYASRTYDANSRPATYTDFNGNVTAVTYDTNGLLTKVIDAQGSAAERTTTTTWDTALRVPLLRTVVDHPGAVVQRESWSYNGRGQVLATCAIDPAVTGNYSCGSQSNAPFGIRQTRYTYCDAVDATQCPLVGLLLTVDGPRTDVADITRLSYYLATDESGCATVGGACHRAGDLAQSTDALGKVTSVLSYDKAGRILRRKDANGVITDFTYTPRGWLSSRTIRARADGTPSSGDVTTTMAYDATGTLHSIVDPDGVTLTYTYDAAHRLTDITDGAGNRLHYTLDAAGHRVKEETFDTQQVSRRSVSRSYNPLGQLIGVTDGLGHKVFDASGAGNYDANGNLITSQGPLGAIHQDTYDALNRVVTAIDDANGAGQATRNTTMQYVLDALDRVTKVTDPDGLATQYGFDGLGRPTSLNSPDSGASAATFDAAGNALTQTDARGVTVTNVYDALGRRSASQYADAKLDVAFNFDEADSATGCQGSYAQGRLTRIVESAVTTTYCYDALGRVTEKRQKQGAVTDTTDYVYTRAGRLAAVAVPSGTVTEYTRDALGEITSVKVTPAQGAATPVVTAATYLPFGPLVSYTLGNGQVVTRSYDANYQVTDVTSPALNLHFARDAAGNITALGDAPGAQPASETYGYDPLYRLTSVNDASGQAIEAYTYNKTGDRLSKQAPGLATGAYGYASGTHWLTSIGTASRTYDANGSTTGNASAGNAWGYGYDGRGRMTIVQQNGVTVGTYTYNVLGQRVAKVAGAASIRFAYAEDSQLLGEYGASARDYIWIDAVPVAVVDGVLINYLHVDGLNTPRAVTAADGTVQWQWASKRNPFGEQAPSSGTGFSLNLRVPGQYFDAESGLSYNVNRDYESATGRYIQSDPIGLDGGMNTYAYVVGNPLIHTDPSGLQVVETMLRFPVSTLLSDEPILPRPLISPKPGFPERPLPDNFPPLPKDGSQCPGDGWEWRGPDAPGGPRGGWYNPEQKWTLHPDLEHPEPIGPHWDWVDENKSQYRLTPQQPFDPGKIY